LRRVVAADSYRLYELDNDPEVMRFINGGIPVSLASIEQDLLPNFLEVDPDSALFGFWALIAKNNGAFVGWLSLRRSEKDNEAILGYRLLQRYWGKGYAIEGAKDLVARAFTDGDVERIVATTYEHNLASRRVMERLGMRLVKRFRMTAEELVQSDTHHVDSLELWEGDDVEYALNQEDWRKC
jgi:RimJ/RimL family protein N-acetyltransferase